LEAPKPNTNQSGDSGSVQPEPAAEVIAMPPKESEILENKRIPVPEHVEPEPEKRGFWSRFFKPNG
jgi:hypothetical protein